MRTSELPVGSILKFKNPFKVQLFYEQINAGWSNQSSAFLNVRPDDIFVVIKTAEKNNHVGQTVMFEGRTRVLHYVKDSFIDLNQGVIGQVDLTVNDYYYDILG